MKRRRDPFESFRVLGLADPAYHAACILTSARLSFRMKAALLLYLEGLSERQAARAAGLRDHMGIHRAARRRDGLQRLHEQRQAFRQSAQSAAHAKATLGKEHASVVELASAAGGAADALFNLLRLDHALL